MFKRNYLVIYDICNDKIRRKIVKLLEAYGYRVQYSAFECSLNLKTKKLLIKDNGKLMTRQDIYAFIKKQGDIY